MPFTSGLINFARYIHFDITTNIVSWFSSLVRIHDLASNQAENEEMFTSSLHKHKQDKKSVHLSMNKQPTPSGVNRGQKGRKSDHTENQIRQEIYNSKTTALGYPGKRDTLETWLDTESGESKWGDRFTIGQNQSSSFDFQSLTRLVNVREFGIRIRN